MKKAILALSAMMLCVTLGRATVHTIGLNTPSTFTGTLNGSMETPPNASTATGGEGGPGITYDDATGLLDINVAYGLFGFNPLQGDYTAAHIHEGAFGVNGPIVVDLAPIVFQFSLHSGLFQGSVLLTPSLETALFSDDLYMNIFSSSFPAGEIRAQLVPSTVPEGTMTIAVFGALWVTLLALGRRSKHSIMPVGT